VQQDRVCFAGDDPRPREIRIFTDYLNAIRALIRGRQRRTHDKKPHFLFFLFSLCALAAVMMGCASSPHAQLYTLCPGQKQSAGAASYSIAVGPVRYPLVDRPQIVCGPAQPGRVRRV
jgi:hypothetical protein